MCVHMCIMNMHVHGCVYAFSCFPCYFLELTMTMSFYLSPKLIFNKLDWIYSEYIPVQGLCTI